VAAHERPFRACERRRFRDDRVGDRDLADIVQRGGAMEVRKLVAVDAQPLGNLLDELRNAVVMVADVRVASASAR
jgi:hypothetical protein